jgi:acetyl esterase/lipase
MASEEFQGIVAMLRSQPMPAADVSVEEMRAGMERLSGLLPPPEAARFEATTVGGVPGEWVTVPESDAGRIILYLHGGAYMIGSPLSHRNLVARLAQAAGARALSLAYRLAPEHPFPAAVEDATAAYRALLASGIPARQIAIAGDSAGGGLTLATLVALRYFGAALPAAGVCLSPWVDLEMAGASWFSGLGADPILTRRDTAAALAYLNGAPASTPLASPLFADLRGLPPLIVHVGSAEPLLSEDLAFVEKARSAGVDVTLEVWPEMFHVWQMFAPNFPEATQAIENLGSFMQRRIPGGVRQPAVV